MKLKLFLKIISVLLAIKVVFGIIYLIYGWQVAVAGRVLPIWLIVVAIIVDGYLAYLACKFSKKK